MKALITGSSGTVGTALRAHLTQEGWRIARWDRSQVPIDDYGQMEAYVRSEAPDLLFHLAAASQPAQPECAEEEAFRVNYEWSSELAWIARELGIPFVFTSTVMVFTDAQPGPYTLASPPNAEHGYGLLKKRAEARIFAQNPRSRVARLGWQIGHDLAGNQMAAWLQQRSEEGKIEASLRWIPACSFVEDTASALLRVGLSRPGLYHLDANEGFCFYDLACALRERHGASWEIEPSFGWAYDQRLIEGRWPMTPLAERLPELRRLPATKWAAEKAAEKKAAT